MTGHYPSKQKHLEEVKQDGHYSCEYKKGYERKETRVQVDWLPVKSLPKKWNQIATRLSLAPSRVT